MDSLLRADVAKIINEKTANFIVTVGNRLDNNFVITLQEDCVQLTNCETEGVVEAKYCFGDFEVNGKERVFVSEEWARQFSLDPK